MRIENGVSNNYYSADANAKETTSVAVKGSTTVEIGNEKRLDANSENIINDEMLENAVRQANKNLDQYNKVIERSVHEKTHAIIYVLKDALTNEVIREFPPRKIQDMIAKMWEIAGILVDERR